MIDRKLKDIRNEKSEDYLLKLRDKLIYEIKNAKEINDVYHYKKELWNELNEFIKSWTWKDLNLNEYVWDHNIDIQDKLNYLGEQKREAFRTAKSQRWFRKGSRDVNWKFKENIETYENRTRWTDYEMAYWLVLFTKYWRRKYNINIKEIISTKIFLDFFKTYLPMSRFLANKLHIYFYANNGKATLKQILIWANKLVDHKYIVEGTLNEFLKYLESGEHKNWKEDPNKKIVLED